MKTNSLEFAVVLCAFTAMVILGTVVLALLQGCRFPTIEAPNGNELLRHSDVLAECRAQGLDAGADGGYEVYEACKRHMGVK